MAISRYPMEQGEIQSTNAKLLYVTHSRYEHDWTSMPHEHPFAELCYILKGKGNYLIEDQVYPVKERDFIIINANVRHTEQSVGEIPLEYIILGVEGLSFASQVTPGYTIFNCSKGHETLEFFMKTLFKETKEQQPEYKRVCKNLLEILIVYLTRNSISSAETPALKATRDCVRLKQYIDSNYTQAITLDTLTQLFHLNKYYLVHTFTKRFGISPMNYLGQVRIQASKELLGSTDYSITQIAHSTGFSSPSYFSQCFLKSCGITAREYRRRCRQQPLS